MQTNQGRKCGCSPASLHQPPPPSLAVALGYHTNTPCWATLGVKRGRTWVTHLPKRYEFESSYVRWCVQVCLCILFTFQLWVVFAWQVSHPSTKSQSCVVFRVLYWNCLTVCEKQVIGEWKEIGGFIQCTKAKTESVILGQTSDVYHS